MAAPIFVNVTPHDTWTKVATNVKLGSVHRVTVEGRYFHTYQITGGTAPTDTDDGVEFVGKSVPIDSAVGIDVYIFCTAINASVRVDI